MARPLTCACAVRMLAASALSLLAFPLRAPGGDRGPLYTVPPVPWAEKYGNHRAVIDVRGPADAVHIAFLWRRHDRDVGKKRMLVLNASGDENVRNVFRVAVTSERCELIVGPVKGSGRYYLYYLPFEVQEGWGGYAKDYLPPEDPPDARWVAAHGLSGADRRGLTEAEVRELQSRTDFDSFYPMEVTATKEEKASYLSKDTSAYLLFPEDRKYPIRMTDDLPLRWMAGPPAGTFEGSALRNEYYAFQIGVFAARGPLEDVQLRFGDLRNTRGAVIQARSFTCFNREGVDPYGKPFMRTVNVPAGALQALWIGIDIPDGASPGKYSGAVAVRPKSGPERTLTLRLEVRDSVIADRGDGEPWRHSRLRWLNSRSGIEDAPIPPYPALKVAGDSILCLGRSVTLDATGLPKAIRSWTTEVLSAPIRFIVDGGQDGPLAAQERVRFTEKKDGVVRWESVSGDDQLAVLTRGTMEFDGYINYTFQVTAKSRIAVNDIRLEIPYGPGASGEIMGMGLTGRRFPDHQTAKWDGPYDSFWAGSAGAGLYCELRGAAYTGPLLNLYRPAPPESWYNKGAGGFLFESTPHRGALARVSSGERVLTPGDGLMFECSFIITPVKERDTRRQFTDRYFHNPGVPAPGAGDLATGIKIINVHHANAYNPFINYPFIANDSLKAFVDRHHAKGLKVKLYYTVRELTNHVTEIWALRSLGDEILSFGGKGGYPWLREHLISDYAPQWYQHYPEGGADAALLTSGISRWYNYYIEGLGWLVKNIGIDGLYLDDVAFDRAILKRMRRVMERVKPGCLIDLHSNTAFSMGPANQYLEFFPYVDKLWFGESFQYDAMSPDAWLVETSGIPFGLMGDMLQGGGNPWRGMVYGMTNRLPWPTEGSACDPRPVWKVWDEFGIERSTMIGYWQGCPVGTDHPEILATAYVREGRTLIALASWAEDTVRCRLTIDWERLGIDSARAVLVAPAVRGFQDGQRLRTGEALRIEPKKGRLLILTRGGE